MLAIWTSGRRKRLRTGGAPLRGVDTMCQPSLDASVGVSAGKDLTMRKNISLIAVFMLLISLIFISCAPESAVNDSDEMEVYFGYLEAKDVDTTAYNVSGSATWGSTSVTVQDATKYYWVYKATKADTLFKKGECGWTNVASGAGLGSSISGFSKGKWTFELRAYASAADRTAGLASETGGQYLFSGSKTTESLTGSSNTVNIPVAYSYIAGKGTVNFTITTSITQDSATSKGAGVGTYSVSKVEAIIDGKTINLTGTSGTSGTWKGTATEVTSGAKVVGLNVYVTGSATGTDTAQKIASASNANLGTAYVLHGLTTEVTGTAKVTLTAGTMGITFTSTLSGASGGSPGIPDSSKVK